MVLAEVSLSTRRGARTRAARKSFVENEVRSVEEMVLAEASLSTAAERERGVSSRDESKCLFAESERSPRRASLRRAHE